MEEGPEYNKGTVHPGGWVTGRGCTGPSGAGNILLRDMVLVKWVRTVGKMY